VAHHFGEQGTFGHVADPQLCIGVPRHFVAYGLSDACQFGQFFKIAIISRLLDEHSLVKDGFFSGGRAILFQNGGSVRELEQRDQGTVAVFIPGTYNEEAVLLVAEQLAFVKDELVLVVITGVDLKQEQSPIPLQIRRFPVQPQVLPVFDFFGFQKGAPRLIHPDPEAVVLPGISKYVIARQKDVLEEKETGISEIIFKNSGLVEAGCTKSNFIKGLKIIENYMQAGRY
jgi:hypothetical protein